MLGTIEPMTCKDTVTGISDFVVGAVGVPDIVAATQTTPAVMHGPDDRIIVEGNRTAIDSGGQTIYVGEWQPSEAGGWLLGQYSACEAFIPPQPEE